ncbi:hypothetical protein M3Y96_01000600 [Aphelenchoides besseyi]|nr:hypothetical protein M3Y96_01000600 [Aphelenchoides besseyi]
MFLYRLHLVKNRTPPKSLPFFLYASVPICSFFLYSFSVVKGMSLFETSNSRTIENRVLILKHVGFQLSKTEIFEVDNKVPSHIHAIFAITMLIDYSIIVFCVFRIRRVLRSGPTISTTTRRLNRAMDRVLMFNAFFPLLSYIFPSGYTAYAINSCADFPWFGFLYSILMNLSFIFCPISTTLFIRPYRRTAMRWLQLNGRRRSSVFKMNGTLTEMKLQRNPIPHFSLSPIS